MSLMPATRQVMGNDEHSHVVQFYSEESSLVEALGRSLFPVLAGGNSAIVIGTREHRLALARALEALGIGVSETANAGRYVVQDATESLAQIMLDGLPDATRFSAYFGPLVERTRTAAKNPVSSVFVFGEMVALLWAEGAFEAALQLERLWNELLQANSFQLYCAYPVSALRGSGDEKAFLRMCREHTRLVPADVPASKKNDSDSIDDALGELAFWQQRAQLELEAAGRARLRTEMEQWRLSTQEELEARVAERTAELRERNEQISRRAEELDQTNQGLRDLSVRLMRAQDDERWRIARDLHDGTSQELALLNMSLSSMHNEAQRTNSIFTAELAECSGIVRQVCTDLRTLCYFLHPPLLDEIGLSSALRWFVDEFGKRNGILVRLELPGDLGRLERGLELALFRVVQECLTNIHLHSGGDTAFVQLERNGGNLILQISDNGRGIPADKLSEIASAGAPGIGLRGVRERIKDFGGHLEVTSNGNGTRIRVTFPVALAPCQDQRPEAAA